MCPIQTNKDFKRRDRREKRERERERERIDKFLNQTCFEIDFEGKLGVARE